MLKQDLPGLDVKMSRRFQEACEQVAGLENDIQALCHRCTHQSLNTLDSKQLRLAFAQSFQKGRTSRLIFAATPFQKTFRVKCHFASSVFCRKLFIMR